MFGLHITVIYMESGDSRPQPSHEQHSYVKSKFLQNMYTVKYKTLQRSFSDCVPPTPPSGSYVPCNKTISTFMSLNQLLNCQSFKWIKTIR